MRKISASDMVLLNTFVAVLAFGTAGFLLTEAVGARWGADNYAETATVDESHMKTATVVLSHFYDQGRFDMVRELALKCEKEKANAYVATWRTVSQARLVGGIVLCGLGLVFLLNAHLFRPLRTSDAQSRSNP